MLTAKGGGDSRDYIKGVSEDWEVIICLCLYTPSTVFS